MQCSRRRHADRCRKRFRSVPRSSAHYSPTPDASHATTPTTQSDAGNRKYSDIASKVFLRRPTHLLQFQNQLQMQHAQVQQMQFQQMHQQQHQQQQQQQHAAAAVMQQQVPSLHRHSSHMH